VRRFSPGEEIEVREVWDGRTWEVRMGIVVEDSEEVLALYTPPGSPATIAAGPDGVRLRLPPPEWELAESAVPADRQYLALHPPEADHTVLLIWDEAWQWLCWYINLERCAVRTERGIEYEDHLLDVVVRPDLGAWHWKDEDELAEAVERGLVSAEKAARIRGEGERALDRLLARMAPYDRPWGEWRPPVEWGRTN
jgi:hypothetical protein